MMLDPERLLLYTEKSFASGSLRKHVINPPF